MEHDGNWYVYALFSPGHNRIYIGMTSRPDERLKEHNRGKMRSTKAYRPWKMVYKEKTANRTEARNKEKFYKTTSGRNIIRNIVKSKYNNTDNKSQIL